MKSKSSIVQLIFLFLFILLLWGGYRLVFRFPDWVDEIIFKPIGYLVPMLYVVFALEKRGLESLGTGKDHTARNILLGVAVGIVLIGQRMIAKQIVGGVEVNPDHLGGPAFGLAALTSVATGITEEITFRGYFFARLNEFFKNEAVANIVSTVMFVVMHLPLVLFILHYSPSELSYYSLQIFMLGVIFAYLYARTGSLTPSIAAHAVWNFSNAIFR